LEETVKYLMAGYVRHVAMLFETAPRKKAINAERDSGDVPFSALLCLFFSARCFS